MYSPAAIEKAPASSPATPATITTSLSTPAPATPKLRDRLETRPSLTPKIAARSAPERPPARCSAIGPGCGTTRHVRPRRRETICDRRPRRSLVRSSSGDSPFVDAIRGGPTRGAPRPTARGRSRPRPRRQSRRWCSSSLLSGERADCASGGSACRTGPHGPVSGLVVRFEPMAREIDEIYGDEGGRWDDRYGVLFLLILTSMLLTAANTTWLKMVSVVVQGGMVLFAFLAARAGRRAWRLAIVA